LVNRLLTAGENLIARAERFERIMCLRPEMRERIAFADGRQRAAHRMLTIARGMLGMTAGARFIPHILDIRADVPVRRSERPPRIVFACFAESVRLRPPPAERAERQRSECRHRAEQQDRPRENARTVCSRSRSY